MRILLILAFLFLNKVYTQNNDNYIIINLEEISESTLIYKENGFDFYFNKSDILKKINDNINYYSSDTGKKLLNKDDKIKEYKDYYAFIKNDDCQLILINPYKQTPIPSTDEIENNIQYQFSMKFHFIACDLISSGKCLLKKDNVEIDTLIKKEIEESGDDYYNLKENFYTKENSLVMSCLMESIIE